MNIFQALSWEKKTDWLSSYYRLNINKLERELKTTKADRWQKLGAKKSLAIFHAAAKHVPAYKNFLYKNKVAPAKITTAADLAMVPPTDKANYIQKYSLAERSWFGKLENSKIIASSSGTSGSPNYWPRGDYQEYEAAIVHELLFKNLFGIDKKSTLAVIAFPMGVYVSGVATLLPSFAVAQKYPMSLVSAGNNKDETIKAIKNLKKNFEQILLIGHPFFIKDVLETGRKQGISWNSQPVKMMFCSEGFSEHWREYVLKATGLKQDHAFSTYGCSEMLLMAYETPLSVKLRKLLNKNLAVSQELVGSRQVPNIFQYNPALRYVEEQGGELLFTSAAGLPLVRFNLHDSGKILDYDKALKCLPKGSIKDNWQLPFLTVAGRSDYAVIFYAANIYPSHIHASLSHRDLLKNLSGKFTMTKGYYKNMDEFLEINIELLAGIKPNQNLKKNLEQRIFEHLKNINSEFRDASQKFGARAKPQVRLWAYGHEKYFRPGLKPKYIA